MKPVFFVTGVATITGGLLILRPRWRKIGLVLVFAGILVGFLVPD
jgi:hypothetical protein